MSLNTEGALQVAQALLGSGEPLTHLEAIVRWSGWPRRTPGLVRNLAAALAQLPWEGLEHRDMADLVVAVDRAAGAAGGRYFRKQSVGSVLRNAKLAPQLDPVGRFRSHTQYVPRAVLDARPILWRLPVRVALRVVRLDRTGAADVDVDLLVEIVDRCVSLALVQHHHRRPERVADSRVIQVFSILGAIARMATVTRGQSLRTALLAVEGPGGALELVARTVAFTHRTVQHRTHLPEDRVSPRSQKLLWDFLMLVRSGVLVTQGVPPETVLSGRGLFQRMVELEREDPEHYAARERCLQRMPQARLTPEEVERLYAACRGPRDRAVLALLAESAFRATAVSTARVGDVWDVHRAEVHPVIALLEKGSRVRRNVPNQRLREALRTYVLAELGSPDDPTLWLVPQRHCPRLVSRHCAEHTIRYLCRTVGLPGISPHSFRRYVVNLAMQAGNRLETVQKWLGHASAVTTMRHYWTDDPPELPLVVVQQQPPPTAAPAGDGMLLTQQLLRATLELQ